MTTMAEPLSEARLAAIEARCAAAGTPAPDCACGSFALQYDGCRCERARWEARRCNAEAAALADVPDLVAEVRRLRRIERLVSVTEGYPEVLRVALATDPPA